MQFSENQAIYLQIADRMCDDILSGTWREGEKIPSVREMAVNLEVNPNTVMRTYGHLQDLDVIVNQRGIGYFVKEGAYDRTMALKKEQFITGVLPILFHYMDLLQLTSDDLKRLYDEHRRSGRPH
jgi:DNA-binding transcriptional regulator YhcF (GntR family)